MNVVYHNLINNSHSIINQSKLHHFHLFSFDVFFLLLLFVVLPTLWHTLGFEFVFGIGIEVCVRISIEILI